MTTAVAWMAPVCALIGILVAVYLGRSVLKADPGSDIDKAHLGKGKISQCSESNRQNTALQDVSETKVHADQIDAC